MHNSLEILNSKKYIRTTKIKDDNIENDQYQIYEYQDLPKYFTFIVPYNQELVKYNLKFIEIKKLNIFNNIFSKSFQRIIHLSVINWINKEINNDIFKTRSNRLNQPGIAINSKLFNSETLIAEPMYCRQLDTTNTSLLVSSEYKIHINIKLKYLFWVVRYLIINSEKFIIKIDGIEKPLFSHFKIHTDFWNYTVLFNTKKYHSPNIVMYQYQDSNPEITKICFRKLVKTLLELFPDKLKISSKVYSKFTFRINNNIYLCIGEGDDKINKSSEYTIPIEYKKIIDLCSNKNNKECKKYNKIIKKLSNHDLFIENDDINYLVKKNNNSINRIFNEIGLNEQIKI